MLDENKIPNIDQVDIIENGRGLKIQFGCNTHFVDKRDLFNLPSWNDRKDNRIKTMVKLTKDLIKEYKKQKQTKYLKAHIKKLESELKQLDQKNLKVLTK